MDNNMNKKGRFGDFGGQYVPETVMNAVSELEEAYRRYKDDPEFKGVTAEHLDAAKRFSEEMNMGVAENLGITVDEAEILRKLRKAFHACSLTSERLTDYSRTNLLSLSINVYRVRFRSVKSIYATTSLSLKLNLLNRTVLSRK